MAVRHYNIPVFIPELACPFQCIYCDQRKITGKGTLPGTQEILQSIEAHLSSFKAKEREVQLAFFGGTFTGLPRSEQERYLNIVRPFLESQNIDGIRISTRPDYIDVENLKLLKDYGVTHIELGAQSLVDEVLQQSRRGHSVADVERASRLIRKQGFVLGLQMMIGLPGDSFAHSMQTAQKIVDFGAAETRIYPTVVISGTSLEWLWQKGRYRALDTDTAIEQSAELYTFFEKHGIKILRVGLYPSEDLSPGKAALAGPELPHFKEKVLSRIWRGILEKGIDPKRKESNLRISVAPAEYNYAVGFGASNRHFLERHFAKVKFIMKPELKKRDYEVVYY
jgi:histone acetyltransferase (RNA polymerase elongator complex component)